MLTKKLLMISVGCASIISLSSRLNAEVLKTDSICLNGNLGEVVIKGTIPFKKEEISGKEIEMHEKEAISDALNLLPGVINVPGAKSDQVFVRGFNQKQIPVYYDGVPIYIPYDGILDLDMLMATDVSKISVVKGAGTMLYGPNALGGAINIVTSSPEKGFTGKVKLGSFTNGKYTGIISAGYGTDKFYLKAGYAMIEKNNYKLSSDYVPTKSIEDGGSLENSWKKTSQISAKVGWTPAEGHEYVFSYVKHDGEKGIPPYLGSGSSRYWQFPIYDKESYYLITKSKLSPSLDLKTRIYFDKFDNTLESYDDSTYTTQTKKYAFTSIYDDYSYGAIGTLSHVIGTNTLTFDAQYKYDDHLEHNVGSPIVQMTDQSGSFSLVDLLLINDITLQGGLSYTWQKGLNAEYLDKTSAIVEYPQNNANAFNAEINATYTIGESDILRAGLSYKTRFPTMKDRYSQSFGKTIPNPYLKDENALNYTLDYSKSILDGKIKADAGVFYSSLKNAILSVYGVDASDATISQLQNTGKAEYYGADLVLTWSIIKPLSLQANYSYVKRNNLSNPTDHFTGVPVNSIKGDLIYSFKNDSYINLNVESYTDRYSNSTGLMVDGFTLVNLKAGYNVWKKAVKLEAGINNMFDTNYLVSEGYPLPGRNAFASIIYTF